MVKILEPRRFAMARAVNGFFLSAALLIGALLAFSPPAWPQAEIGAADIFSVEALPIDATAEDANRARTVALAEGQRRALRRVFERLAVAQDYERLPRPGDEGIAQIVSGFEIRKERVSPERYRATLNVNFKPDEVRWLLRNAGVRFAETPSRPLVILPVYVAGDIPVLWDEPNPWREIWAGGSLDAGLVPLILPLGDLGDMTTVSAEQAMRAEPAALGAIAGHYGAAEAVAAVAVSRLAAASEPPDLKVTLLRPRGGAAQTESFALAGKAGEDSEALLQKAAAEVVRRLEEQWKWANLLQFGSERTLRAEILFQGLTDWLAIRDRLAASAVVSKVDLLALSLSRATAELSYLGGPDQLVIALWQVDLELSQDANGWTLRRRLASETPASAGP